MSGDEHRAELRPAGLARLVRGLPGHPLHPPLTDVTIGTFALASALAVIGYLGVVPDATGPAAWLALLGGLLAAAPTAATGFADWVSIEWGSPAWRTATFHLTTMLAAVALFGLAAWAQHDGYRDGRVTTAGLVLTLAGMATLTAGGWLGGAVVFVHGVRVLRPGGDSGPVPGDAPSAGQDRGTFSAAAPDTTAAPDTHEREH